MRFFKAGHLWEKEDYRLFREKEKDTDRTDFRTENRLSIAERSHWQCSALSLFPGRKEQGHKKGFEAIASCTFLRSFQQLTSALAFCYCKKAN